MKDCTVVMADKFLFENVVKRFGCPKILLSHQGSYFLNETISKLIEVF